MKDIFCAKCQTVTPHRGVIDANGEFVFTCTTEDCGRFIKFPAAITKQEFDDKLIEHHEQNVGQVSLEGQEIKLAELIGDIVDEPTTEAPTEPQVTQ